MNLLTETALSISYILIKNGMPNEISGYIFKFLDEDIKKNIKLNYFNNKINNEIKSKTAGYFTLHFNEIPYFNNKNKELILNRINRLKCRKWIISYLKEISEYDYKFSHYCCNGEGIVIKRKDGYSNRIWWDKNNHIVNIKQN